MPPRQQFSQAQRTWLALEYHKRQLKYKRKGFIDQLIADFLTEFPGSRAPAPRSIRYIVAGFKESGTVLNRNSDKSAGPSHSGRPRTVRTVADTQRLKAVLDRDSTKRIGDPNVSPVSTARRNVLNIPKSSFSRITKELKYHPYKENHPLRK